MDTVDEQEYGRVSSLADTVVGRTASRVELPYTYSERVSRVESAKPVPAPRTSSKIKRRPTSGPRMGLSAL